jgi:TonB family protein
VIFHLAISLLFAAQGAGLVAPPVGAAAASTTQQQSNSTAVLRANPDTNGVYHDGPGVTMPQAIHQVEPEFSEEARKKKAGGTVGISLVVDEKGNPTQIRVTRSAAEDFKDKKTQKAAATLDPKAIEAVSQYRFTPGQVAGKPVPVELKIKINFQIF